MAASDNPQSSISLVETRFKLAEEQLRTLQAAFQVLKGEVSDLRKAIESLEAKISESANRYVVACPACETRFDMLAHHYSIGLFDNMVYVKCPKCNKALPIQGGSGGAIRAVADETT